jgi:HAD domain in Swiss Army Knife RNA repair proteins
MKVVFLDFNGTIDKTYRYKPGFYDEGFGPTKPITKTVNLDDPFPPLEEGEEEIARYGSRGSYRPEMSDVEFEALLEESLQGPKREKSLGEMTDEEFNAFVKGQEKELGMGESEVIEIAKLPPATGLDEWLERRNREANTPKVGHECSWLSEKHRQEMIEEDRANEGYQPSFPGIKPKKNGFQNDPYGLGEHRSEDYYSRKSFGMGDSYYSRGGSHYGGVSTYVDKADDECVKYLRKLIEETGAVIVYSTTRRYSGWKSCADYVGLPYEMSLGFKGGTGITPTVTYEPKKSRIVWFKNIPFFRKKVEEPTTLYKARQEEIQLWFKQWKGEKIESYVILDDDTISDPSLAKHWVASIKQNKFLEAEYKEALKILKNKK